PRRHRCLLIRISVVFYFNALSNAAIYTLSLHDALPIYVEEYRNGAYRGVICILQTEAEEVAAFGEHFEEVLILNPVGSLQRYEVADEKPHAGFEADGQNGPVGRLHVFDAHERNLLFHVPSGHFA